VNVQQFTGWLSHPHPRRPLIMGVLNITPDSFSDGGKFTSTDSAAAQADQMIAAGADLIDIGGESTRPGASSVPPSEQLRRVIPGLSAIAARSDILISIDTTSNVVAAAACDAGAGMINDISAGRDDPAIFALAARAGVPIILMHMQGTPKTMQENPTYGNVVEEVGDFLLERKAAAISAGVRANKILLDPGIGFGKTDQHSLHLLRETSRLASLGSPLVIGASRKGFIGRTTGETPAADRIFGTAAVIAWCAANGCGVLRVHDVGPMAKVVRMVRAIAGAL
jgi:dihydropteroate synthase